MINIGIIGSGFIVPSFIEATKAVKGFKYLGIASPNEEQLKNLKEKYDIKYYSLNNEDVYSDPNVDVIYVAVPNGLHYEVAMQALKHGKHVIVEKPFMSSYKQAKAVIDLAKKKDLIVFEAITLRHLPNYKKIQELIPEIGEMKMVDINFSQYSSRYDKFKKGITLPAFDPKLAGGCLMDLGVYSIHFVLGLFGVPKNVHYFANIKKNIDTSGTIVMDYGSFKATIVTCKDCKAPLNTCVQGDSAYIKSDSASSVLDKIKLVKNDGTTKEYDLNKNKGIVHYNEFKEFKRIYINKDMETAQYWNLETLKVMKVIDKCIVDAGLKFE